MFPRGTLVALAAVLLASTTHAQQLPDIGRLMRDSADWQNIQSGCPLCYDTASEQFVCCTNLTYRIGHTWAIYGDLKIPVGTAYVIPPFFVSLPTGQTAYLAKAKYMIQAGTSVTLKLQKNGSDVTGWTGISVSTSAAETDPTDVALADGDKLQIVVTAVSGTPRHLSFTLFVDYGLDLD